jgi:hypothetical protein
MKPHRHSELIKAWANGAEIQVLQQHLHNWVTDPSPSWHPREIYRVKPEPKPDVVNYLVENTAGWYETHHVALTKNVCNGYIRIVRDGETGKIKESRII